MGSERGSENQRRRSAHTQPSSTKVMESDGSNSNPDKVAVFGDGGRPVLGCCGGVVFAVQRLCW
jgi:hypothetical protein